MNPNWDKINAHRDPQYSDPSYGFNGFFCFVINGLPIKVIASDGEGWRHVSVSIHKSSLPPSWSVMCQVKDIFFGKDEWVVQFHPSETEYVNNHPGCLHLWQPTSQPFPTPPAILVGLKNIGNLHERYPGAYA